ncbi:sulfotransferase family protein [Ruegeria sp. MALMAid1280]|uniref:sulfotransferase family protein n=1 Tax=Ruegeria sp. MALMAid1280 TaxID=3411634 RepID=UPI003BA2BBDA
MRSVWPVSANNLTSVLVEAENPSDPRAQFERAAETADDKLGSLLALAMVDKITTDSPILHLIDWFRGCAVGSERPIFGLGMPRSGTTLTESILDAHSNIFGAGELNDLRNLFSRVAGNPFDTCLSCYTPLFERSQLHSYDLVELGRYYTNYVCLMNHWRDTLPEGAFLTVRCEALVDDIEAQTRRLLEFFGLGRDSNCLGFHARKWRVRTASASGAPAAFSIHQGQMAEL